MWLACPGWEAAGCQDGLPLSLPEAIAHYASPGEAVGHEVGANDFSPARHGLATHAEKADTLAALPGSIRSRETIYREWEWGFIWILMILI